MERVNGGWISIEEEGSFFGQEGQQDDQHPELKIHLRNIDIEVKHDNAWNNSSEFYEIVKCKNEDAKTL